ncbi:MAG: hypothetical protein HN904_24220, partial [Victivallales bacterium]|nr:hypothetical protein [Victivallales bacterium]
MLRTTFTPTCVQGLALLVLLPALCAAEPRVRARAFPTETRLVREGKPNVLIVHGEAHRKQAEQLRAQLRRVCGMELPLMLDTEATAGALWTLRDEVQRQNLIVLGDINTNRAVLALYAKFLAAATGRFPGPGRYVLRHLAEPFVPGKTAVVVGASDGEGLRLGVARLVQLLADGRTLGFPLVEFGDADGPTRIPESNDTFRDYRDAAYVFYAGGRPTARYSWFAPRSVAAGMRVARELVLAESAKQEPYVNVGGHYTFIPNYQALRIIVAHGLLSADEIRGLEEKLIDNALAHKDSYVVYYRGRHTRTMSSTNGNPSRHSSSTVVGQYLLLDYLMSFADMTDDVRAQVATDHASYTKIIRDWHENRIFRARVGDLEALDCTAFFIYAYMHMGLEGFVHNGMLENMANFYLNNVNNLWCDAGASHYIGAYRGCHIRSPDGGLAVRALAFFSQDRGLEFLDTQRFERAGNYRRGFTDAARMCLGQPEPFALPPVDDAAVLPCPMLRKTPLDPCMWASTATTAKTAGTPLPPAYEHAYDAIGFRDGWAADDAFLGLKGVHGGRLWQVNSIFGYTEFGARLLFGGSQTHENWYRSSITVDTSGYSSQDDFARLEALVSSADVGLVVSTCARFNGTRWQRTVVRRRGSYFAVLDDLTALDDGDFRLTATWRVLPPGATDGDGVFRAIAPNGTGLAIEPGGSYACDVTRPAVDGVARPTLYRQQRDETLGAGETISFHNVLSATPAGRPATVRAQTLRDRNLLRVQSPEDGTVALVGTRELPGGAGLPTGSCAAFYLDQDLWLLGGIRELRLGSRELLRSSQPVDAVLDWASGKGQIVVRGTGTVNVVLAPELGGAGDERSLAPGTHAFELAEDNSVRGQGAVAAPEAASRSILGMREMARTAPGRGEKQAGTSRSAHQIGVATDGAKLAELWCKQVQTRPASLVRPYRVEATRVPDSMALHNLYDGVMWSSSIPPPTWNTADLVLTLAQLGERRPVAGLRLVGNVGAIEVEARRAFGLGYRRLQVEETANTLFAGYSDNRVGGRLYRDRLLTFAAPVSQGLRVRLSAADPAAPRLSVGEIQLLGGPHPAEVWGRLLLARSEPGADPVLYCRTGTRVDTLEQGGLLQAFTPAGQKLWQHAETAPAQYREKYWCMGDVDADDRRELVTYADDMVVRVFAPDGRVVQTVDLHAWEDERKGSPVGHIHYGGKSIALWPTGDDGCQDLFIFGHVHHHQIRFGAKPEVVRR